MMVINYARLYKNTPACGGMFIYLSSLFFFFPKLILITLTASS